MKVAEEVAWIVDRYDPDQLWYADDVFTISHPWLYSYRKELEARGLHLPFETITRADRLQSEEAVRALKALGCHRIWIGSESGSQRILDAMERGVTTGQVRTAVRLAKDHGIAVGMFLMGLRGRRAGRRRHRRAREADRSGRVLHDHRVPDQGHAVLRCS